MEKMKLTQYIINEYLVPRGHYFGDKIIFVNCSNEFLELAKDVAQKENKVKACFVKIDEKTINLFTEIQALFHVDIQKTVMTRTLLSLLVLREVMKKFQLKEFGGYDTITLDEVNDGIKSFHEKNIEKMKVCYFKALLPTDLDCITDKFGKGSFELNFVLPDGNDNLILQKNINDYIYSHNPFCVKVFTSRDGLPVYLATNNESIEPIHDFRIFNYDDYEKIEKTEGI